MRGLLILLVLAGIIFGLTYYGQKFLQPREIKSATLTNQLAELISIDDTTRTITLDHLRINPAWEPGVDSSGPFAYNDSYNQTAYTYSNSTIFQLCAEGDADQIGFNYFYQQYRDYLQNDPAVRVYFDADGINITKIGFQCLP